ncbi:MAG: ribosomal protein S18 acetylase RimI-like enzyme [Flavobacteriaceae bacterium]|jgi:ribosomal protein S18 acetylase RimI-like enzyme|tara:strand:- start:158 stop:634 length:477 start_codon:yes stop_codon:yes gene_type:complete
MSYQIREAKSEDMEGVWSLIQELAEFEKVPDAVEVTVEDLRRDGFQNPSLFNCYVAENDRQQIVGIALFYPRYSTWKGPVIHLEDLVVSEEYRGLGIGNDLLKKVVAFARDSKVKRVSWEVLDWNEPAIAFYESKGAHIMRDWNVVQLDKKGIDAFER